MHELKILGLCGSLREKSVNKMLLRTAITVLPTGMKCTIAEWRAIPPFDADVLEKGMPAQVEELSRRIAGADGVLIAIPEYNFSMPGVFKNVLDWLSRSAEQPFARKPVAIMSATPGPTGGARVQYDLRRTMLFMDSMVLQKPEVFVGGAAAKFLTDGTCIDEVTLKFIASQMQAFGAWIEEVRRMRPCP